MTEPTEKLKTKGVEAVDKALRILSLFDEGTTSLSLGEISARTGLVKSSVLRLMISLQNAGYVFATADKRYVVGVEAFRVGQLYRSAFSLEEVLRPALREMVRRTGESGSFFRREGDLRVCLFREDSDQPLREHVAEGAAAPIERGAAGHVLLDYERYDGRHVASAELLEELPYVSVGERGPGIAGLSAPVFSVERGMLGALSLSGPDMRFPPERIERMKPVVLAAAAKLSAALRSPFYERLDPARMELPRI